MVDPYRIETTPNFERGFKRLDPSIARRIISKIERLAAHPEAHAQPLRNLPPDLAGLCKCRLGDYRVLFWQDDRSQVITLYAVAHRSTIYKHL